MKTLKTILIVLAAVLLIITAVLYFVDTPVVEEGQEPTLPQKVIILGKEYLAEILTALGVSGIGAMTWLYFRIRSSAQSTLTQSQSTGANVKGLVTKVDEQQEIIKQQDEKITVLTEKLDILSSVIMTVFSLSDMPTNVRGIVHAGQETYKSIGAVKKLVEQVSEPVQNAPAEPTQASEEETKSAPQETAEEKPSGPVFLN